MSGKFALAVALSAAMLMPVDAFARGGHSGNSGGGSSHATSKSSVTVHSSSRRMGGGGGGHSRRFWHGRWYAYGVGSCWRWSNVYGEFIWVCG